MVYDNDRLNAIYDRTDGYCHICHKKLAFKNHGKRGAKGAWHVEHSVPRANGGTEHLNNLFPACIGCNLDKGTVQSRTARSRNGTKRAPYSATKKEVIRNKNTAGGMAIGGIVGSIFGPGGAIIGAAIGGAIGNSSSPKK